MEEEVWKDVLGYDGLYKLSNLGRVKRLKRVCYRNSKIQPVNIYPEKILVQKSDHGYPRVSLYKDKIRKYYYVHRLVARAFIPNPENKPEVNHINGIKNDYSITNLEWVTDLEQRKHALETDLQKLHCEHNGRAKLSPENVKIVFKLWEDGVNQHEIARRFGVHRMTIHYIIRGKHWKKLTV